MDCGTLTTASWPPSATPVMVTATSVVLQQPPQPPRRTRQSPSVVYASALDVTSAHPRHPLPMAVSRSPMWYAATTRSQRGYALGRSTMNFTTKAYAEPSSAANTTADGATPEAAAATHVAEGSQTASAGASSSSHFTAGAASDAPNPVASGAVMLPDAMVFSFKGNPHEFQERLRGANVLVFFYKAMCGPCAVIRSRLIHAVTDRLPMEATSLLNGTGHKKAAAAAEQLPADAASPHHNAGATAAAAAAPLTAASSPAGDAEHNSLFVAPTEAEAAMAVEDKAACAFACRTLEDVARAYPHRMIFLTVDTNDNAKLTALHDIRSLPTFVAYRDGCMVGRVEGADEEEVRRLVQSITAEQSETIAGDAQAASGEESTSTV